MHRFPIITTTRIHVFETFAHFSIILLHVVLTGIMNYCAVASAVADTLLVMNKDCYSPQMNVPVHGFQLHCMQHRRVIGHENKKIKKSCMNVLLSCFVTSNIR